MKLLPLLLLLSLSANLLAQSQARAVMQHSTTKELLDTVKTGSKTLEVSAAGTVDFKNGFTLTGGSYLKTALSLNNVENTALSTWTGSTNLTTLGTITTGTWSASTIALNKGGTGATTAADARTNLGLVIGTDVQAYNANLTTFAGIAPSANVQSLLGAADYSAMRSQLGLVIGTDVQAYNANLTTFAGIAPSANVQSLLGAADYAAMRSQLSLPFNAIVISADASITSNRVHALVMDGDTTLTLPASPADGDYALITQTESTWTGVLTIARNGNNINGAASDLTYFAPGFGRGALRLTWINAQSTWIASTVYDSTHNASLFAGISHTQAITTITGSNTNRLFGTGGTFATGQEITLSSELSLAAGSLSIASGGVTNAMLAGSIDLTTKVTGALPIANGGTGQTTAANAINALLPTQTGNSGKVLGTNGTAASWTAKGKVVQMVFASKTDTATSSSTSFTTLFTGSITPTSSSNVILVLVTANAGITNGWGSFWRIARNGSTVLHQGDSDSGSRIECQLYTIGGNVYTCNQIALNGHDAPATTSATTYELQGAVENSGTIYINRSAADANSSSYPRTASTMIILELEP